MCWSTNKHIKMQIADEDISVFKIVFVNTVGAIHSYYHSSYEYKIGVPAYQKIKLDPKYNIIHEGLHCYRTNPAFVLSCNSRVTVASTLYLVNFPYTVVLDEFDKSSNKALLFCSIPKGTTFVENELGIIVSECLIPKEYELLSKW